MRILHVVPTYLPAVRYGGPIYSVHALCAALAARGHEVHVHTTNVDGPGESAVPLGQAVMLDGVRVWYFPTGPLRRLYYSPRLGRALRNGIGGYDVMHLHSVFLWPTLAAARAAAARGVPYVLSPRGMLVKSLIGRKSTWAKTAWIRLFERRTLEAASAIHLTSETERRELDEFGFRLRGQFVLPNGIDLPEASVDAAGRDEATLLFLGRVDWKKGLDRLIPALAQVPSAQLLIAGNDEHNYRPELERLAAQHRVGARLRFLGPVYGEAKRQLLRRASLFVLPSYSENFGNAVLEAMAEACPVVVTPEVGLAEAIERAGAGVVCGGEPAVLGQAIRELLGDAGRRRACGEAGRALVLRDYHWNGIAAGVEQQYRRLASDRTAVAG